MGSYAILSLESLNLAWTKNDIDPRLMWIFRPSEKHTEQLTQRNCQHLPGFIEDFSIDEYDEYSPFTRVVYRCTAAVAKDRLDLKGFTYEVAKAHFTTQRTPTIQRFEHRVQDPRFSNLADSFKEDLRVLRTLTVENWREGIKRINEERITTDTINELPITDKQLPLLRYMLTSSNGSYGYPEDSLHPADWRHLVRIALEAVPPQEDLTYDLSDLVVGGWVDETDNLVAIAEDIMNADFPIFQRVIVLTEGSTDRDILKRSLKLLYPHLADYFHFFDFTARKVGGGSGELANLVRAFAAADIKQRVLALFDNDTAAKASLSSLNTDSLPSNIAVHHYPAIPIASNYPTIGPAGKARMDVNGTAGSIELYLGQDVLRDAEGLLSPVRWTGYDRGIREYQGEMLDKQVVLGRFMAKLANCEQQHDQINSYDWQGIRAIIDSIRGAFNSIDTEAILSDAIHE